jgi:Domain of unknown function (DUF5666)
MRRSILVVLVTALALAVTAVPSPALQRDHGNRGTRVEGRVVSVNRDARSFRLRDHDSLGTFTVRVTALTKFERLRGFSAVRPGRQVEATVTRVNGRLFATKIEPFSVRNRNNNNDG